MTETSSHPLSEKSLEGGMTIDQVGRLRQEVFVGVMNIEGVIEVLIAILETGEVDRDRLTVEMGVTGAGVQGVETRTRMPIYHSYEEMREMFQMFK